MWYEYEEKDYSEVRLKFHRVVVGLLREKELEDWE